MLLFFDGGDKVSATLSAKKIYKEKEMSHQGG